MNCAEARTMDIVDYLESIGYTPIKIKNNDHWCLSPLRTEKTPSFKVNRNLNIWFDHGIGQGGDLIDFGTRYHRCSINELLLKLDAYRIGRGSSFHRHQSIAQMSSIPRIIAGEKKKDASGRIIITGVKPLESDKLLSYLRSRHVSVEAAKTYCREVDFSLYGKTHTAVGFRNNSGGYELRSEHFKGACSPKDVTLIKGDTGQRSIRVLEGFIDFLSLLTLEPLQSQTDFLVLNSLSFAGKSVDVLKSYEDVSLFLDHDPAGRKATTELLQALPQAKDASLFYAPRQDINDYLRQKALSLVRQEFLKRFRQEQEERNNARQQKRRGMRM